MGKIINVQAFHEFEGNFLGYWAKGWHDTDKFIAAIEDYCNGIPDSTRFQLQPQRVRHTYYRNEPTDPITREEAPLFYVERIKGGRGCYPVTVLDDTPAIVGQTTLLVGTVALATYGEGER